jgi:hypothetical protein
MRYVLISISCAIAVLGVTGVFVYIPGVSDYAFWIVFASYIILGSNYVHIRPQPNLNVILAAISVSVVLASVVAVFIYIPFLTDYSFWFLVLACVVLGASHFIAMSHPAVTTDASEFRAAANVLRDPRTITRVLTAMLWISIVVDAIAVSSGIMEFSLLQEIQAQTEDLTDAADASDLRQWVIGVTQMVLYVVTAIVFLRWIYILNDNKRRFEASGLSFTPGWAVGWFFVPFAMFWKPYQAMKELWQVSIDPKKWQDQRPGSLLPLWWLLWVTNNFLGQAAFRLSLNANTLPALQSANIVTDIADIASVALGFAALALVTKIAGMQQKRIRELAWVEALA